MHALVWIRLVCDFKQIRRAFIIGHVFFWLSLFIIQEADPETKSAHRFGLFSPAQISAPDFFFWIFR
jgi:hypothetical protein